MTNWMSHNFVMLNSDETQVITLGTKQIRVNLDGIALSSNTTVRNLDIIFEQEVSYSKTAFFYLCNNVKIWQILSQQDA